MVVDQIHKAKAKITAESDKKPADINVRLSHRDQLNQILEKFSLDLLTPNEVLSSVLSIMRKHVDYEKYYKLLPENGWSIKAGYADGDYGITDNSKKIITIDLNTMKRRDFAGMCVNKIAEETRHAWQYIRSNSDGHLTLGNRKNIDDYTEPIRFEQHSNLDITYYHNIFNSYDNMPTERDAKIFANWMVMEVYIYGGKRFD